MGADPSEFTEGLNPFSPSIEITLNSEYANNDSLRWIAKELKRYPKVTEISYQKDLVEAVNRNLAKIGLAMLTLAVLLTFVSFSLINNTVRLGIYARRFSIHTMKLVGASWSFIRRPFMKNMMGIGLIAAVLACGVLGGGLYWLTIFEPGVLNVVTWIDRTIVGASVVCFGLIITALCSFFSLNRYLRMSAGELYKI